MAEQLGIAIRCDSTIVLGEDAWVNVSHHRVRFANLHCGGCGDELPSVGSARPQHGARRHCDSAEGSNRLSLDTLREEEGSSEALMEEELWSRWCALSFFLRSISMADASNPAM